MHNIFREKMIETMGGEEQREKLKRIAEDMKGEFEEKFSDLSHFSTTQLKAELRRRKRGVR